MIGNLEKQRVRLWFALGACGVALGCGAVKDHDRSTGPAEPAFPRVDVGGSASTGIHDR